MTASDDYRALVLGKNPVGYWRLGEANDATNAVDETGRHHGQFLSVVPGPTKVVSVDGVFGNAAGDNRAIVFDGTNYLEVPNSPDFSQKTHNPHGMTVEAWMRPSVLDFDTDPKTPYVHWMGKGKPEEEEWALRFYRNCSYRPNRVSGYLFRPKKIDCYGRDHDRNLGTGADCQEGVSLCDWMHVVVCYQPGDCRTYLDPRRDPADHVSYVPGVEIYVNGRRKQGPPTLSTLYCHPEYLVEPTPGTQPLRIGARDVGSRYPLFQGAIDEVAIYPRLLTAEEIREHFEAARHG